MTKTHFCFGISFFFVATCGTLLLTWTVWWLSIIGHSVPARRPFFHPTSEIPPLVVTAASSDIKQIFSFSLAAGWPKSNSAIRLIAAITAVLCSFTFAFIASLTSPRFARIVFCSGLSVVAVFATLAGIVDLAALARTATECGDNQCTTSVPDSVLSGDDVCQCSLDPWFFFTVGVDFLLAGSAILCLILTVVPMIKRRGIDPSY